MFGNKEELCTITAPLHLHSVHLPEPDKYTHTSQVQVSDGGGLYSVSRALLEATSFSNPKVNRNGNQSLTLELSLLGMGCS